MRFFSLCSFSTKRALLKALNEQDLYKKGAQDMVCMLLNLGADLIQNPYCKEKEISAVLLFHNLD